MKYNTYLVFGVISTLTAVTSSASVSLVFQGGNLRDSNGVGISNGSLIAIFADNNNDSILVSSSDLRGQELTTGNLYGGNELIGIFAATDAVTGQAGGYNGSIENIALDSGLAADTTIAAYWFVGHTGGIISANTEIGSFRTGNVENGSTSGWVLPGDGGRSNIFAFDSSVNPASPQAISQFTAEAIPEPSSTILLGLGTIGFALRRRR